MIAHLKGKIILIDTNYAVVSTNGVGYQVYLPKHDLLKIDLGQEIALFIHSHIKEDAFELFGFFKTEQKQLFQLLISVSGIGPKIALVMLSSIESADLIQAISMRDLTTLSSIPGIGKKTAERQSLELKDKVNNLNILCSSNKHAGSQNIDELQAAILSLGYSREQARHAISQISPEQFSNVAMEDLVKQSLKILIGKSL